MTTNNNKTDTTKRLMSIRTNCSEDKTKKALNAILSKYKTKKAVLKASFKLHPCEQTLKDYINLELWLKAEIGKLSAN